MIFRNLMGHMETDHPVYAVEYSQREESPLMLRMEDLAAHYIEEIRELQPRGPYYLLGYSFGGLLAYEIAQQLHAVGERVELLGMLDTYLMNGIRVAAQNRTWGEVLRRKVASLGSHLGRLVFGPRRRLYVTENLAGRLVDIIGAGQQYIYGVLTARGRPIPKFLHRPEDVNLFAALRYHALPYPGRVTMFRASVIIRIYRYANGSRTWMGPARQGRGRGSRNSRDAQ